MGDGCPICYENVCTYFPIDPEGDLDGDGMGDALEEELARQFKPYLVSNADQAPWLYNASMQPIATSRWDTGIISVTINGVIRDLPIKDTISMDTVVYYRVTPRAITAPGECWYIEITYWFYYPWNRAECNMAGWSDHSHDWEHIALAIIGSEGDYEVSHVKLYMHEFETQLEGDNLTNAPSDYSDGYIIYIAGGSHGSYAWPDSYCTKYIAGVCVCSDNPSDIFQFPIRDQNLIPLYELNDPRRPVWLDYSDRWPGYNDVGITRPNGPAKGDHEWGWSVTEFGVLPNKPCWRWDNFDLPGPTAFSVDNTDELGQQMYNELRLSWSLPPDIDEDAVVIRRKKDTESDDDYQCIATLDPGATSYLDEYLEGSMVYDYTVQIHRDHEYYEHRGCSVPVTASAFCIDGGGIHEDPDTTDNPLVLEGPIFMDWEEWADPYIYENCLQEYTIYKVCVTAIPRAENSWIAHYNWKTNCGSFYDPWKSEKIEMTEYQTVDPVVFFWPESILGSDKADYPELQVTAVDNQDNISVPAVRFLVIYEDPDICEGVLYQCGNANGDASVNTSDAVYIINYVFIGGAPPIPFMAGDVNCDYSINVSDAVYLIDYVFTGGRDACDIDGDGELDCHVY